MNNNRHYINRRCYGVIAYIAIIGTWCIGITSATVPTTYIANAGLNTQIEQTSRLLTDYQAAKSIGKESSFNFKQIDRAITSLRDFLPQTDEFRVVYKTCDYILDDLAKGFTTAKSEKFYQQCYRAFNNVLGKIQSKYTVTAVGSPSPARGPAPLTVSFKAYGSDDPSGDTIPDDNYFWYYSDTRGSDKKIGRGITQNHTFTEPGEYKVYLTVRSRNADKGILDGSQMMRVTVDPKAANFRVYANGRELVTSRPVKIGENEAKQGVVLDGSATTPVEDRTIIAHRWRIEGDALSFPSQDGEGPPGSIRVPLPSLGTYAVYLTVTDNNNNTDTVKYQIVIEDPVSIINMTPSEGTTSSTFSFDGGASYSLISRIASYDWTVSVDGKTVDKKQQSSFKREFVKPGNYTTTLEITDALGKSAVDTASFVVKSTPPVASFSIRPEALWEKPSTFILDASATSDVDVANNVDSLSYEWKVEPEDGMTISAVNTKTGLMRATADVPGTYTIMLTARDSYDEIATMTQKVEVQSALRPNITVSQQTATWDEEITFNAQVNKNVSQYVWDFGDGDERIVNTPEVKHAFDRVGVYNVKLTVRTDDGETNSVTKRVFIGEKDAPVLVYDVYVKDEQMLPTQRCVDKEKNTTVQAYDIHRYQDVKIDVKESRNVNGNIQDVDFLFKQGDKASITTTTFEASQGVNAFDTEGCVPVQIEMIDRVSGKRMEETLWFNVSNAPPTMDGLSLSLPQYGGELGIGFNVEKLDNAFEASHDPILIRVSVNNPIDVDGRIVTYKRYYYSETNPSKLIQVAETPYLAPYKTFTVHRTPGTYIFGVQMVDNDKAKVTSEELGFEPRVSFPTDTKKPDKPNIKDVIIEPRNVRVGEEVKVSVISELPSGRDDFEDERVFKYDFDRGKKFNGYEKVTKSPEVTHIYTEPGTYQVGVDIEYRGEKGGGESEDIVVSPDINADAIITQVGKTIIVRDTTFGEIVSRRFCLEYKSCLKDASLNKNDTAARFFAHTYETPGKKLLKLERVDAYDNIAFKKKNVTIPASAFAQDAKTKTQLVTLPESEQKNISVTSSYDNAVLFYPMGDGCWVDVDDTVDTDGDGVTTNDKDGMCNQPLLHKYEVTNASINATFWGGDNTDITSQTYSVNFVDYTQTVPEHLAGEYQAINQAIAKIVEHDDKDQLLEQKVLLRQIADNLNAPAQLGSLLNDLDTSLAGRKEKINGVAPGLYEQLQSVAKSLRVNTGLNGDDPIRQHIMMHMKDPIVKRKINEAFDIMKTAEGTTGSTATIKSSLDAIYLLVDGATAAQMDPIIRENLVDKNNKQSVCRLYERYQMQRKECAGESDVAVPTVTSSGTKKGGKTGSIVMRILKYVGILLGILVLLFVLLVIVFAIKARREAGDEDYDDGDGDDATDTIVNPPPAPKPEPTESSESPATTSPPPDTVVSDEKPTLSTPSPAPVADEPVSDSPAPDKPVQTSTVPVKSTETDKTTSPEISDASVDTDPPKRGPTVTLPTEPTDSPSSASSEGDKPSTESS